jgi:hypothetical protein
MEIWKAFDIKPWIQGYPQSTGIFIQEDMGTRNWLVSNHGNVKLVLLGHDGIVHDEREINQFWKGKTVKYLGIPTGPYVHRLVAQQFVENPNGYKYVTHIDGDLSNNHEDNLEWIESTRGKRNK